MTTMNRMGLMRNAVLAAAVALAGAAVCAKLPAPDPAAKAKADETAAKAAWQAKVDAYQLCKAQDRVAAVYLKSGKAAKGAAPTPTPTPVAAKQAASAASAPASSAGTPAAAAAPTPCSEPGPFAYNAPEQKPLETSGAHSPAGNAASPPSVRPESSQMAPAKK